jgi:SAM-dependent methyltransferase
VTVETPGPALGEAPLALSLKERIRQHWEADTCGARYGGDLADRRAFFDQIERTRYEQDYMLRDFARFESAAGQRVLEVGLGTGTDFIQWARAGAEIHGVDLTEASIAYVRERLELYGLSGYPEVGDAEALTFPDNHFDVYYSWGVLHHTPDMTRAIAEAFRVLKPGGELRLMLYHARSVGSFLVWLRYGLLSGRWRSLRAAVADNVESPGTQVLSIEETRHLVGSAFKGRDIEIRTFLGAGDLLTQIPSAKYQGAFWRLVFRFYPRWLVRAVAGHRFGTVMTVRVRK